jgi:hypothetical protein
MSEDQKQINHDEDELSKFVPLTCFNEIPPDQYEINKLGEIRKISTNKILKYRYDKDGYKKTTLTYKGKQKNISIHRAVALMFIPNDILERKYVDHIDRNILNNSYKNLRWVTSKENIKNRKMPTKIKKYSDSLIFVGENDSEEITELYNCLNKKDILNSIKTFSKFNNFSWKLMDKNTYNVIKQFSINLDICNWKLYNNCYFNEFGIIKTIRNKITYYSLGTLNKKYYSIKGERVHRIIYKLFSNDQSNLLDNEVIDHKNCNKLDNRLINLSKCSQKGNMNNPNTLKKRYKEVLKYSHLGKYLDSYESVNKAGEENNIENKNISSFCRGHRRSKSFIWCFSSNTDKVIDEIKNSIFLYKTKEDKFPENITNTKRKSINFVDSIVKNCILTGQPHPKTGYYYSLGLKNWETGEQIIPDVTPKIEEKEDQK